MGVGDADFSRMNILDADDEPLIDSNGIKMSRDIVQFVSFKDHNSNGINSLAKEVLHELPDQIQDYMWENGLKPLRSNINDGKIKRKLSSDNDLFIPKSKKRKIFH